MSTLRKRITQIQDEVSTCAMDIVADAVRYFFFSIREENKFINAYKYRYVNNREDEEKIYLMCSEELFNCEFYIMDKKTSREELKTEVLLPLCEKISPFLS